MKKFFAFLLSLIMLVCLAACSEREEVGGGGGTSASNNDKDATYSKLYIGNFDGGYGDEWLKEIIKKFKEKYANYSFEEGKVGVDIEVDNVKGTITGSGLFSSMASSRDSIFFTEDVNYYDGVTQGVFADITDAVTSNLSEFGESGTIVDKLPASLKEYYKNSDGRYYGLPFYDGFGGFYYDKDLFDQYLFYFKDGAEADVYMNNGKLVADEDQLYELFVHNESEKRGTGPDGVEGTYDDGLPATYADFYALLEYMASYNIKAFTWCGSAFKDYSNMVMASLWADYEGKDNIELLFNMSGTATDLISVDANGNVTTLPAMQINESNAYNLHKQAGKYYSLQFVKNLVSKDKYYSKWTFSSQSNTAAQEKFVDGKYSSNLETIAMIVEGSWWYSEAKAAINSHVATEGVGASWDNRNIGFMPMPKATRAKVGEKSTIVSTKKSVCVVNNLLYKTMSQQKKDLVMKFLAFCHTNDSLYQFTKFTGATRPFEYNIDSKLNEMNYFAKSIYNVKKNYDIVYPYSKNATVLNNGSLFEYVSLSSNSNINGTEYNFPAWNFQMNNNLSVKDYFEGMYNYYQNKWSTLN